MPSQLSISIILNRLGNEIVKCSRCQSRGFAYIIEPSVSQGCSECVKAKKAYDLVGLIITSVTRWAG